MLELAKKLNTAALLSAGTLWQVAADVADDTRSDSECIYKATNTRHNRYAVASCCNAVKPTGTIVDNAIELRTAYGPLLHVGARSGTMQSGAAQ